MQSQIITLTSAGADTGPFNLLSNVDGFVIPFESAVSKLDLEAGYFSTLIPDAATIIRVRSNNPLCNNYIDLTIETTTTTTSTTPPTTTTTSSTSTSTSTTSTTTTAPPEEFSITVSARISGVNPLASGQPVVAYTFNEIDFEVLGTIINHNDCAIKGVLGPYPTGTTIYFRIIDLDNGNYIQMSLDTVCPPPNTFCQESVVLDGSMPSCAITVTVDAGGELVLATC